MGEIEAHVRGVVRDITDPTGRTMYVLFDRAMSDDDMRNWHDRVNDLHPASPLGAVEASDKALQDALAYIDKGHHGMARNILAAAIRARKGDAL